MGICRPLVYMTACHAEAQQPTTMACHILSPSILSEQPRRDGVSTVGAFYFCACLAMKFGNFIF